MRRAGGCRAQQDDALVGDTLAVAEIERYLLRVRVRVGPLGLGRLTLSLTLHAGVERHQGARPFGPRSQLAESTVRETLRPA